jgi:hypothetical protein
MRIVVTYESYNPRRYSRPWIGRVTNWRIGVDPEMEWGGFTGDGRTGGIVEVEANPGDIIRHGQKEWRNVKASLRYWRVVEDDGTLRKVTPAEAREHFFAGTQKAVA